MSTIIWTVSYYVAAERYWQFAGEGSREWAVNRADYLKRTGHEKVRIRWRHGAHATPIAAVTD